MLYKRERKEAELIKSGSLHAILWSLSFCLSSEYLGPVGAVFIFIGSLREAKADFMLPWERFNIGAKRCAGECICNSVSVVAFRRVKKVLGNNNVPKSY